MEPKQRLVERQNNVKEGEGLLVFTNNYTESSPVSPGCSYE